MKSMHRFIFIFKCLFWTLIVGGHFENFPDDKSRNSTECTTFSVMALGIGRHLLLHSQLAMNKKIFFTYIVPLFTCKMMMMIWKNDFFCISHDVAISGFHLYWLLIVIMQFLCLSIENARFSIFVALSLRNKKFYDPVTPNVNFCSILLVNVSNGGHLLARIYIIIILYMLSINKVLKNRRNHQYWTIYNSKSSIMYGLVQISLIQFK